MAIRTLTVLRLLLLLLACISSTAAKTPLARRASSAGFDAPRNKQDIRLFPSANCPNKCGNLTIEFPFGVGPDCFRHPDFAVTCDNTTNPPKLLLMDGVMEVVGDGIRAYGGVLVINMSHAIPMSPGVDVYNNATWTWNAPATNFNYFRPYELFVSSCDLYPYFIAKDIPLCTTCSVVPISECYNPVNVFFGNSFQLNYVRTKQNETTTHQLQQQIIVGAWGLMFWSINDEPTCAAALADQANFGCVSTHSSCTNITSDARLPGLPGYSCSCDVGYTGNPYVLDGCSLVTMIDELGLGYNISAGRNVKCSRSCGKIKVPFPFGLEDGCSARTQFRLSCNDSSTSWLSGLGGQNISYINISEGFLDTQQVISQGSMEPAHYDSFYFGYRHSYIEPNGSSQI